VAFTGTVTRVIAQSDSHAAPFDISSLLLHNRAFYTLLLGEPSHPNRTIHAPVLTLSSNALAPLKGDNASYIPTLLEVESLKASALHHIGNTLLSGQSASQQPLRFLYYITGTTLQAILFPTEAIISEWGHYTRAQADGLTASIGTGMIRQSNESLRHSPHFWDVALQMSLHGGNGYVRYQGPFSSPKVERLTAGAALNNLSALSGYHDEQLYLNGGASIFSFWRVMYRVLAPTGSETSKLYALYTQDQTTTPLTASDSWNMGLSTFWSGSTLAYLRGLYHYLTTGQDTYEPLLIDSFLIPNQTFYATSSGFSRNVTSGYRWSDRIMGIVGVEWVEKGQPFEEYTAGIYLKNMPCGPLTCSMLSKWMLSTRGTISSELWLSTPLTPQLTLKTYLAYWDQNSLIGERHTLDYQHRHTMQLTTMVSYTPLPPQPIGE